MTKNTLSAPSNLKPKISNPQSLRVLMVEDSEDDALLVIRELKKGGYNPVYERVETEKDMRKALREKPWDVILCDYTLPKFSVAKAIALLKETNIDIPFLLVTGSVGEELAVECMRLGAQDYIMKNNLSRLCPVIARELGEAEIRSKHRQAESQRVAALEALKASEKYFKEITENSSDIVIIMDKNGDIKYCSPSIERFTGYKPEELIGKSSLTLIHPDDKKRAVGDFGKAIMATDSAIPNAFCIVHKDGSERYFEGLGKNRLDNPAVAGFIMNVHDITERKQAEEERKQSFERMRKALRATVQSISRTVEMKDPYTSGHQRRVSDLARSIATEMGLAADRRDFIRAASSIHDISKIAIPSEILSKPTKLTDLEFRLIKTHSQSGYDILKNIEFPWPVADVVLQHHERMDGSGYPQGLKGNDILLEARIMAVADVVESMASHRPYRPALGIEIALEEIEKNKGILYDNTVTDACLKLFREKSYQLK
jgi:PAS domain S-box-containing protein